MYNSDYNNIIIILLLIFQGCGPDLLLDFSLFNCTGNMSVCLATHSFKCCIMISVKNKQKTKKTDKSMSLVHQQKQVQIQVQNSKTQGSCTNLLKLNRFSTLNNTTLLTG